MSYSSYYYDNPYWEKMRNYALSGPVNGGHYKRWVQGSSGMMSPMHIYSNEYSYTYMKHGQNDINPYRGNIKHFAPSVTHDLRNAVRQCTKDTINAPGCQMAAVRQIHSIDDQTPHPFDVSYNTGFSPYLTAIPPMKSDHW